MPSDDDRADPPAPPGRAAARPALPREPTARACIVLVWDVDPDADTAGFDDVIRAVRAAAPDNTRCYGALPPTSEAILEQFGEDAH